ncbi:MAG: hypothetical protein VX589_17525 [Myxococcota bacterium]|nr:hypothetical protein [Myxococcota bacterium]
MNRDLAVASFMPVDDAPAYTHQKNQCLTGFGGPYAVANDASTPATLPPDGLPWCSGLLAPYEAHHHPDAASPGNDARSGVPQMKGAHIDANVPLSQGSLQHGTNRVDPERTAHVRDERVWTLDADQRTSVIQWAGRITLTHGMRWVVERTHAPAARHADGHMIQKAIRQHAHSPRRSKHGMRPIRPGQASRPPTCPIEQRIRLIDVFSPSMKAPGQRNLIRVLPAFHMCPNPLSPRPRAHHVNARGGRMQNRYAGR